MDRVDLALDGLVRAVIDSTEYMEYERQLAIMKGFPELKRQIDEFRHENYEVQQSAAPDELFDKMDELAGRAEELRKNPMVDSFLNAELEFCRMIQKINQKIVEAVNFE